MSSALPVSGRTTSAGCHGPLCGFLQCLHCLAFAFCFSLFFRLRSPDLIIQAVRVVEKPSIVVIKRLVSKGCRVTALAACRKACTICSQNESGSPVWWSFGAIYSLSLAFVNRCARLFCQILFCKSSSATQSAFVSKEVQTCMYRGPKVSTLSACKVPFCIVLLCRVSVKAHGKTVNSSVLLSSQHCSPCTLSAVAEVVTNRDSKLRTHL